MKKISLQIFKNLPPHEKKITFSTQLTLARLFLVPFIIFFMIKDFFTLAFTLFVIAAITDVLDGFFARYFNQRTFLGAALDTLVDKILAIAVFFTLAFLQPFIFIVPYWLVLFVLIKEGVQIAGAFIIYYVQGYINICPTVLGKTHGVVQNCFIGWLFFCHFFKWAPYKTYYLFLTIFSGFVIVTFVDYLRIGARQIRV